MKRLTALLICLAALLALLAGCSGGEKVTITNFVGEWENKYEMSEGEVPEMLTYFGFSDEEQKFIDEKLFYLVQIFAVSEDGSYRFFISGERSLAALREGFSNVLRALYDKRQYLTDLYGEDVLEMDFDKFCEGYAWIYEMDSVDEYLDAVTDEMKEFYSLDEDLELERGTMTVEKDRLAMTVEGESQAERLGYTFGEQSLLLTYADGEELYSRVK